MQTFPTFTLIHSNLNPQYVTVSPAGLSSAGIFSAGPSHQSYYDSQPVQRTAEHGSPSAPQLPPANLECAGCLQRAVTLILFALSSPGHLFRLSCGHVYCLGCLTEKHHASQHGTDHPIECPQCRTATGFTYPPRQQQCMLAASEAYFQSIRDMNILDPDSPYYRARDLCIMDRTKFRSVLNFVYGSTRNHSQNVRNSTSRQSPSSRSSAKASLSQLPSSSRQNSRLFSTTSSSTSSFAIGISHIACC
jgi:hypothetical protein